MISILMPVYNAAATLPEALASVRAQTDPDWELVALDDGSTDATPAILAQAADWDPRVVNLRRPHRGLVASLNDGLRHCRGSLLARFDADDLMAPDRLAAQRAAAFDGVLGCGVQTFPRAELSDRYLRYETWLNGLQTHQQIVDNLFVESPFAHPSVMAPTELFRAALGYRDMGWPEDYDLWLRLWRAGARFRKLPQVLHYWRESQTRLSHVAREYHARAFRWCKAAALRESYLAGDATVSIWGGTKVGRLWSRVIAAQGVRVKRHIETTPELVGGLCRGKPIVGLDKLDLCRDGWILAPIGVLGAREAVRAELSARGFREGREFVCVG